MRPTSAAGAAATALAAICLAFHLYAAAGATWFTTFDDAYMITRYAQHFLDGAGFSWNAGEGPVYGITSPAYLLLITAVLGLSSGSDAVALTATSFAAGLLAVAALVALGFLVRDQPRPRTFWIPLLAVPYLLYLTPLRYHSTTGMETTFALLANALLAIAVVIASRRRSAAALAGCVLAGYLVFAARPDLLFYSLLLPPLFFLATDRTLSRYALRYAGLLAIVLSLDALLKLRLFGDVLPLSFYAKTSGFYRGYTGAFRWNAMEWTLAFWTTAGPCLALVIGKATGKRLRQVLAIALPLFATLAYYATVVQIMGFEARYYFPSVAFVVLMAYLAIEPSGEGEDAAEGAAPPAPAHTGLRLLIGLLLLAPAGSSTLKGLAASWWQENVIGDPPAMESAVRYRTASGAALPALDWFTGIRTMAELLEGLPPDLVLAASEHGFVGSRLPGVAIVDLLGLHDRRIAREGFSAGYVFSRKPDLLWFPHFEYTGMVAQLLDDPEFRSSYEYYPRAYTYGIALRKSSPHFAAIRGRLAGKLAETYRGAVLSDYRAEPATPPADGRAPRKTS